MNDAEWKTNPIMLPVTAEMAEDIGLYRSIQLSAQAAFWEGLQEMDRQADLDRQYGHDTHHRPDRRDLDTIERPARTHARKVAAIRRNVYGRPAGTFTRGSTT